MLPGWVRAELVPGGLASAARTVAPAALCWRRGVEDTDRITGGAMVRENENQVRFMCACGNRYHVTTPW